MNTVQKLIVLLLIPIIIFGINVRLVLAAPDSTAIQLISELRQKIADLVQKIIALLQQRLEQARLNSAGQGNVLPQQNASSSSNSPGGPVLTVNISGATAYVSVNGGNSFTYSSPITLKSGDSYLVTASGNGGNSTSKCSGTVSSSGTYVCNINLK